ncbi:MAG: hypothetical protein H7Y22_11510 [Gemmatimonadaceae bacterium]|nr:hypothetical protein [Gloeobacterales cyanobacterium ES-bin-141]
MITSRLKRTGLLAGGPVLLGVLLGLVFETPAGWTQSPNVQSENVRVQTTSTILGVGIGTTLEEARARLGSLGTSGGRDTREGGRKEAWTLTGTDFATIALKTDNQGRVLWVSGFVRPGREIPFAQLGDLTLATLKAGQAIWNVPTPDGGYRLVAKGEADRARVVYLLSLATPKRE